MNFLPNGHRENADGTVVDGKYPTYDAGVGLNLAALERAGKIATLFRIIIILVATITIVTSRALRGVEVSFTKNEPTYSQYFKLVNDTEVLNLQCTTTNNTLSFGAFSQIVYSQSHACDWVTDDLAKLKLATSRDSNGTSSGYVPKSLMGHASACKQSTERMNLCELVKENCANHKISSDAIIRDLLARYVGLPTLATEDFLSKQFSNAVNKSFDEMRVAIKESQETVNKWSRQNMPILYAFMQHHMNAIHALRYRNGDTTLQTVVDAMCPSECDTTTIGNGVCNDWCNKAECLFDGGDCMTFSDLKLYGPNVKIDWSYNYETYESTTTEKYTGYTPLSLGNLLNKNATYAATASGTPLEDYKNVSFLSFPTNAFTPFDNDTCASPSSWTTVKTVGMPQEEIDDQKQWSDYSYYSNIFEADGVAIPDNRPTGDPPTKTTQNFACDRFSKLFANAGYASKTAAEMSSWAKHYRSMSKSAVDNCKKAEMHDCIADCDVNTGEGCLSAALSDKDEQAFFLEIEFGAFVNMANENSGSLLGLARDASLKHNETGYDIQTQVNHEKYFAAAGVTSCAYTKKLRPEFGALITVVLAVVGGVSNVAGHVGTAVYMLQKRRILKQNPAVL
jgi:hypothetical protein